MTTEPIRPDLWEITLPAVKAARAAGLEHIASGRYYSKADVPKYELNNHGWSTTTSKDLSLGAKDSPPNWADMFGSRAGPFSTMPIADVPELQRAAQRVSAIALADEGFEQRMSLLSFGESDVEARAPQIEFEYVRRFVAELIARAEATNAVTDAELLDIYLQLERARFAEELHGDLVVPIALTALNLVDPLEIGDGVWVEPLDEPLQRARAVSSMFSGRVSAYVISAATHAVVVRGVAIPNHNWALRRFRGVELEMTQVDRVIQCLNIASGRDTGYAQVIVRCKDWADDWVQDLPAIWRVKTVQHYPEQFNDGGWNLPQDVLDPSDVALVPRLYTALAAAPANVHLATRRALRAVMRSDDEDETIDSTIGIEALLLANNDRDELTHRMAQRAAAALAPEHSPEIIYKALKEVYAHRSAIVHGRTRTRSTIKVGDNTFAAQDVARILLRTLLLNLLLADEPWTPAVLDKRLLSSLVESPEA